VAIRIVLDHNLDWRLKRLLLGCEVVTAKEMGWEEAADGDLLAVAEAEFDVLLTGDKNLRHQQNLLGRDIALIVLDVRRNVLAAMALLIPRVLTLLPTVQPGRFYLVDAETVAGPF